MSIEILPAILVKTREEMIKRIQIVSPYVKAVHVDMMDGVFVPNTTLKAQDCIPLPIGVEYEFHWMVSQPLPEIVKVGGGHRHILHVEVLNKQPGLWERVKDYVKNNRGQIGIAINPSTTLDECADYLKECDWVIMMGVQPGFSGQTYMPSIEEKITKLRNQHPALPIEVDGGITLETGKRAVDAGANVLAAASTIFKSEDVGDMIKKLSLVDQKGD